MRISVIGCGYLGAVHAAGLASLGHDVIGVDVDTERASALASGTPPLYESGLAEMLREMLATGRLDFTSDPSRVRGSQVHFLCVGTPQKSGENSTDLTQLDGATEALLPYLASGDLVVGKSTVPVGTAETIAARVSAAAPGALLAWNPEFLREGSAVSDTVRPDRIVYGLPAGDRGRVAREVLDQVYAAPINAGTPVVATDYMTAELVKVAANSFLATKISFINAMAELCEATGADVTQLADAIGYDDRIGRKCLNAGLGFGGGCLPKDIRAFMARADELGVDQALSFLREVDAINFRRRLRMIELAREVCGGSITGVRVAVLGAAFKPESDDVRDSPALSVAAQMHQQGAKVVVTDPRALANAVREWPQLSYVDSVDEALDGAELIVLLTEWAAFVGLDPKRIFDVVAVPRILDGRNALDPHRWRAAGWTYRALGRP